MDKYIDLRSDTVTKPSEEMRKAIYNAEVGDDVYKEDPTVNMLEEYAAELLGKEAALFVMSGVMGNQICLNVLTDPGDEVICEWDSHIFNYESGSPAALSGLSLMPIKGRRGMITPDQVKMNVRPKSAYYMPKTRVIAIENTHNRAAGAVQPQDNILRLAEYARNQDFHFHLDGARVWNAAVASSKSVKEVVETFGTVSACLSKALGAPIGSVIAGSKDFIDQAFRVRKAWGGGTRQVGILAAAGLYALKNNIERLAEDHEKAQKLAAAIDELPGLKINRDEIDTNILIFEPVEKSVEQSLAECKEKGLLLSIGTAISLRAITHLDVSFEEIDKAIEILKEVFG